MNYWASVRRWVQLRLILLPLTPSWTSALSWQRCFHNSIKLWAMPWQPPEREEFWQNMVHWRRKWQNTPLFLLQESYEQYEKAKGYDTGRWASISEGATGEEQRAITNSSRKMKWLSQRRNVTQLWMCLVVKIKSNVVKNNIA